MLKQNCRNTEGEHNSLRLSLDRGFAEGFTSRTDNDGENMVSQKRQHQNGKWLQYSIIGKETPFHSMNKSSETLTYPSLRAKGNTNPPRHRSTWKQISELKANSPSSCKRNWQHEGKTPIRDTDRQTENKVTYLNRVNDAMWKPRSRSNNLKIQQLQVHWTFQHRTKIGNGITKTLESG